MKTKKAYDPELHNYFWEKIHHARTVQTPDDSVGNASAPKNSKRNDSLRTKLEASAQLAVDKGMFCFAIELYEIVGNEEKQLDIATLLTDQQQGDSMDAIKTFSRFHKRPELLKIIHLLEDAHKPVDYSLGPVEGYVGNDLAAKIYHGFKTWSQNLGYINAYNLGMYETANLAYHLTQSSQFDIGVGIAKGGLELAYLFELCGMDIRIANAHKRGLNVSFNWNTKIQPDDFQNKNVLVFDKDVVSGKTSRRVVHEIERYNPSSVSLCLYHPPIGEGRTIGTIAKNIPAEFQHTYYPADFSYKHIDKVVEQLENSLRCI